MAPRTNWAGNVVFGAPRFHEPTTIVQLQELVANCAQLRVLGTGHSFNDIADSTGDVVSLRALPASIEVDARASEVTVAAAVRYGELSRIVEEEGLALHNLGSLPHISVAGACATATHGSGVTNGNLATSVIALELLTADGEITVVDRSGGSDMLDAATVALGALGVVIRLTLALEPTFTVRQYVYEDLPFDALDAHLDEILSSAYSISLFTSWRSPLFEQVWVKQRDDVDVAWRPTAFWMGARRSERVRHPVPGMPAESCTAQLGEPGPWHERLPHFKLEHVPSSGEELQSEYLVARADALEALRAVDAVRDRVAPVLQVSEVRTVRSDNLWLSPSYGRETVGLHFTWIKDPVAVAPVVALLEERLAPHAARPHWGKVFAMGHEVLAPLYERSADFVALAATMDPAGKFRNSFLDRCLPRTLVQESRQGESRQGESTA